MRVLLTGAAGFIGMHCAERLCARGDEVFGLNAEAVGFAPATELEDGLARYARWFKSHYGYA